MLADPSLSSTVPPPPHSELPTSLCWRLGQKLKKKEENVEGIGGRASERAGRETELIIQIQSLKGKCVFQAVKMING